MAVNAKRGIVIVGGGFAGLYATLELEKSLIDRPNVEITLINRENFSCLLRCCMRLRPAIWTLPTL
jgi:NADH dehydrogenase FAD-containing subunit